MKKYQIVLTLINGKILIKNNKNKGYDQSDPKFIKLLQRYDKDDEIENIEIIFMEDK